ncbi:MAG: hypothetical protein ACR2NP_21320 [Pirellulaceae bacterium]
MLYHGPVRVPEDAAPGTATLIVRLQSDSVYECLPTEIEVELATPETEKDDE